MIVVFSSRADASFENIGVWIAKDNPHRAVTFVDELREACLRLGANPLLHALVPNSRSLGKVLVPPYAIHYRVRRADVLVVSSATAHDDNRLR